MDEEALLKQFAAQFAHGPDDADGEENAAGQPMRRPQRKVPILLRTRPRTMPINRPQPLIPNNS